MPTFLPAHPGVKTQLKPQRLLSNKACSSFSSVAVHVDVPSSNAVHVDVPALSAVHVKLLA